MAGHKLVIFSELSNATDYYSIDIYHFVSYSDIFIFQKTSSNKLNHVDLVAKTAQEIEKLRFIIKKNSDTTLEMIDASKDDLIFLTK